MCAALVEERRMWVTLGQRREHSSPLQIVFIVRQSPLGHIFGVIPDTWVCKDSVSDHSAFGVPLPPPPEMLELFAEMMREGAECVGWPCLPSPPPTPQCGYSFCNSTDCFSFQIAGLSFILPNFISSSLIQPEHH